MDGSSEQSVGAFGSASQDAAGPGMPDSGGSGSSLAPAAADLGSPVSGTGEASGTRPVAGLGEADSLASSLEEMTVSYTHLDVYKRQGGDLTNLVIGQGDVLVTPLQMAVAYCGIATGRIMRPHLLKEVRNETGDVVLQFEPEVVAEPDVDPAHLAIVRDALHGVVQDSGTLSPLFSVNGIDAAGKTGTAEHADDSGDDAWFACYAPYDDPKYVVVCVVEHLSLIHISSCRPRSTSCRRKRRCWNSTRAATR